MKRSVSLLAILLLVDIGWMSLVGANPETRIYVDPPSIIDTSLIPGPTQTIKPNANGLYTAWTEKTSTTRPNGVGTYTDWTGRILTLNPNAQGTFTEWSSWVHLSPAGDGNYTSWSGAYTFWDDDPTQPHDGDTTAVSVTASNINESSTLEIAPTPPRSLSIIKVRLTIAAKQTASGSVRLMLVFGTPGTPVRGYNGSLVTPTGTYETRTSEWSTNPDTSLAWAWSDIDTLQAGVRSQDVTGTIYITQIYLSVLTGGLYTDWDETAHNGDIDYIFAADGTKRQSSGLLDHTSETWTIGKVEVFVVMRNMSRTTGEVKIMLVVGGTAHPHTNTITFTTADTTYKEYVAGWTTKPDGGSWAWSDIDALEAAVQLTNVGAYTGEIRVTQLYVKVIEAPGAPLYQNWDDSPDHNGDIDFVSAISSGLSLSSALEDSAETWTPSIVRVMIVARSNIDTDEKVQIMLVNGTTQYAPTAARFSLSTSYKSYTYSWTSRPWGGAWTWPDINNIQAGVQSVLGADGVWKGEMRVTQLYVVVTDSTTSGNYDDWNDWPTANGDADYVSATWDLMRESSQLEDIASPPSWTIASVRVVLYARATVTTDEQVRPFIVIASAYRYTAEMSYTLTTTYAKYTADWPKNPNTGVAWTWSDINAVGFQAGVQSEISADGLWTGEMRVTQLYVEIVGPRVTVDIKVENVVDLFGYNFFLNYSKTVLTATGITLGSFFPSNAWIVRNVIDDTAGYVWYSVLMPQGSTSGMSGSGTLATVYFAVDSLGESTLDLEIQEFFNSSFVEIAWIPGDVDGDRTVNAYDLSDLSKAYGSEDGDSNWNAKCDFNTDGKVGVYDLFDQGRNYGKTNSYDGYFRNT